MYTEMKVFDALDFPDDIYDAYDLISAVFEYNEGYNAFHTDINPEDLESEEDAQAYIVVRDYILDKSDSNETVLIYY